MDTLGATFIPVYMEVDMFVLVSSIWYTCPVLDFTYQNTIHSSTPTSNTFIYEHNETRFLPIYSAIGVPFWRVSHLSDVPYMLNNDIVSGNNSKLHRELAKLMGDAAIKFAYTGRPGKNWPQAFQPASTKEAQTELPSEISLMRFGGEDGSGAVTVSKDKGGSSFVVDDRTRAVQWEKLFDRCEFINSEQVREEIGV